MHCILNVSRTFLSCSSHWQWKVLYTSHSQRSKYIGSNVSISETILGSSKINVYARKIGWLKSRHSLFPHGSIDFVLNGHCIRQLSCECFFIRLVFGRNFLFVQMLRVVIGKSFRGFLIYEDKVLNHWRISCVSPTRLGKFSLVNDELRRSINLFHCRESGGNPSLFNFLQQHVSLVVYTRVWREDCY